MEGAPVDLQSTIVILLGPVTVAALAGALVWWITHRKNGDDRGQSH